MPNSAQTRVHADARRPPQSRLGLRRVQKTAGDFTGAPRNMVNANGGAGDIKQLLMQFIYTCFHTGPQIEFPSNRGAHGGLPQAFNHVRDVQIIPSR